MTIDSKGVVTTTHTMWCGKMDAGGSFSIYCLENISSLNPKRVLVTAARSVGWINTKHYGWLCPNCADRYRAVGGK